MLASYWLVTLISFGAFDSDILIPPTEREKSISFTGTENGYLSNCSKQAQTDFFSDFPVLRKHLVFILQDGEDTSFFAGIFVLYHHLIF